MNRQPLVCAAIAISTLAIAMALLALLGCGAPQPAREPSEPAVELDRQSVAPTELGEPS